MPLVQGKSKKALQKNIKTEIESGKPLKQALAIAYSVKRKAKKDMYQGGEVADEKVREANPIKKLSAQKKAAGQPDVHQYEGFTNYSYPGTEAEPPYSHEFADKLTKEEGAIYENAQKAGEQATKRSYDKALTKQKEKYGMSQGGEVKHQCEKCGHTMMAMGGGVEEKEAAKLAGGEEVMCAHGGRAMCNMGCYAEGGAVQNEKLHPKHQAPMDARLKHQTMEMRKPGMNQTQVAKLAMGGNVVDEIMKGRKKMAEGGEVESDRDADPAFADDIDLANVHYMEDDEHDLNPNPSDDDYSLVGQILNERKRFRP
jgi:hypothetical protein